MIVISSLGQAALESIIDRQPSFLILNFLNISDRFKALFFQILTERLPKAWVFTPLKNEHRNKVAWEEWPHTMTDGSTYQFKSDGSHSNGTQTVH